LSYAAVPILASQAAAAGSQAFKGSRKLSVDLFNYDFPGLMAKLAIIYAVAWVFGEIVKISNGLNSVFASILNFFGFSTPTLPQWFVNFYNTGFNGIQYWDVIKTGLILIIFAEFLRYQAASRQLGQSMDPATVASFILLGTTLGALTFPGLISRLTFQQKVKQ